MSKKQLILNKINKLEGYTSIADDVSQENIARYIKRLHKMVLDLKKTVEENV